MWGEDFTVYVTGEIFIGTGDNAWDNQKSVIKVDVRYQGNDDDFKDGDVYWNQEMTCTDYTYNGYPIYSYTFTPTYSGGQFRFKHYKNGGWKEDYTSDWHLTTEQIYRGYYSNGHQWMVYGRDVTVYTVPEYLFKDYATKFSEETHYPSVCVQYGNSEWKTINMDKTDYTYDNYPIWKATFLLDYNIFKEFQIKYFDKANSQQVGLYQYNEGGNTEYPSSDLDDKLYHGWNGESHDFFPYTYDVKLDQQDGSGGTESIKATDGVVLPAATMPGRDGYIFGGYYTEIGGRGDQYYDTYGLSSTKWNSRTITTLYAKWTARNYTVNLEDPPTTTPVTVTFDATLSSITPPTKMYYTFDGYWTDNDDTGATLDKQLIDKDGNWEKSISPYTGTSGDNATWIYPNGKSLFAKWDEDLHDVTIAVYPADAGVVQVSGETVSSVSDVGYVTHSPELTAVPSNAAWVFKEWCVSDDTKLHLDLENYSKFDETMEITATDDGQTLTAVFEPRFCLVGAKWDNSGNGGMPGWHDYTADFIVNSYTDLSTMNLTCVRSLDPNTTYKFEVHDKVNGKNLGYATPSTFIGDQSLLFNTQNNDVLLRVNGHGECTFTISALSSGDLYPTVSVAIPASHQLNLEWADVDIDNNWNKTSRGTGGSVSAQTTESGHNFAIRNGEYVAHGGDITYTATPATGYTFEGWYNNDYNTRFSTTNPYTSSNIQTTENVEAKFVEKATAVTLSNDGHGHVEIDGITVSSTTVGVTTTRTLRAVAAAGYTFSGWTLPDNADFEMIEGDVKNPTITLRGKGAGDAGEIVATFTECWVLSAQSEGWGSTEFTIANIEVKDGKAIGYADIALPANTNLLFKVVDKSTSSEYKNGVDKVYYMTYGNSRNWSFDTDKTHNCGITTAGRGSYRFNWNFTDKTMTVEYPESYQVNYGAAVGGSVMSVLDDDNNVVPNGGYVRSGGSVTYEATANDGYTFTGWCPNDSYGDTFTNRNPWENSNVTATSNAYAKFHSTNFVIYRTGDKASDPRAVWDDVESYEGGTISETIEFRMRVNRLDKWYTLCLPFTVSAVKVWDEEDGQYYDIVPYYRTGDKYYTGHYIIRTPLDTTDFEIENFDSRDRWVDPSSADGYLPSKNTPYIIQWHTDGDNYFLNKYISFFGATGQTIPTSMNQGANTSSDETVNIYGNNCMTSGTVRDAYMLDSDYGSGGAWLRAEVGTDRTVLPFECFIRANATTTAKYRVLRRDMADTPTGWDTVSETENKTTKVLIDNNIYIIRGDRMYTIQGTLVKEGK